MSWVSCCLPSEWEQLCSGIVFNKQKIEEKEPTEDAYSHWMFAKKLQKESTTLSYSLPKMPSLLIHASAHTLLSPAGNLFWGAGGFPACGGLGKGEEMSPFQWHSSLFSPHSGSLPASQRPPTLNLTVCWPPSICLSKMVSSYLSSSCGFCKLCNHQANVHHPTQCLHLAPQNTQSNY